MLHIPSLKKNTGQRKKYELTNTKAFQQYLVLTLPPPEMKEK